MKGSINWQKGIHRGLLLNLSNPVGSKNQLFTLCKEHKQLAKHIASDWGDAILQYMYLSNSF
ncbi:hypothetical protein BpJC7_12380 [Weizmannia acidilactici]|uniref:Uncharacterized protein n=1 Tax=Weizmannia acidilactici TaxID=2607726 RepID=A0A5J4JH02_9BACI|nr:hypothetical protein BpJC7_12380 [Weizmannia acidilactici]